MVSEADQIRIAEAVRAAESRTRAELVCVLARTSSTYEYLPLVWAALLALAAPWPLIALTLWSASAIFGLQLAVFLAALGVLSRPFLRLRLVPRTIRRRRAHRAAAEQFLTRGLHRKSDRTGVLIFVSEGERYARIIADDGVARLVEQDQWTAAIDTLIAHARAGRVADGYIAAIALCGEVLARHLPPLAEPVNELSDRFHVI
jgi:putative membrane protein